MSKDKKSKPRHLGRGLQSLLGPIKLPQGRKDTSQTIPINTVNLPPDKELHNSLREIELSRITSNPYQPRTSWDEKELADLADSIRENGIIQPIIVRPKGKSFELIAGERRFRAAKLASLKTIPALIRQASDDELLELALVENIHRTDLNPIERAQAYKKFLKTFYLTQEDAAKRLGESRTVIANHLRLLDLPSEIKKMLIEGKLSMGHARAILGLPTDDLRRKLANRAMAGRLSVREVERLVRKQMDSDESKRPTPSRSPHIMELERKLSKELGTRVSITTRRNGQRGKITINFNSLDEFDRITEQFGISILEEA